MKNLFLFLIIAACCLPACKKGENDPFLSLRSRDARLTGKWILTDLKSESQFFGSCESFYPKFYGMSFNGSLMTKTYRDTDTSYTRSYVYSQEMTINKDGTFTWIQVYENGSYEDSLTWTWRDGNKKKVLILNYDWYVVDSLANYDWYVVDTLTNNNWYVVDRLTNKELVLKYDDYYKNTNEITGYWSEDTYSGTRTYKKE